jgi:phosphatidate cytidylyltransferase
MNRRALVQRIASAVVLLPVVLGALWLGGWWFAALMLIAGWLMSFEWSRMSGGGIDIGLVIYGITLAALVFFTETFRTQEAFLALGCGLVAMGAAAVLAKRRIVWALAGLVYIGIPVLALVWLRLLPSYGFTFVLWVLCVVWAADSAAFFTGSALGGPKLAPTVSPNKTWSGAVGGLVGASLVGLGFGLYVGVPIPTAMVASAFVGLWAELGDLQESWIKRRLNIKDTSNLIPGHGGVLDRLDSLMFAAPVVCLMIVLPQYTDFPW